MRKSLLFLTVSFSVLLCGCGQKSSAQTYQPPISVNTNVINEEVLAKKANTKPKTDPAATTPTDETVTTSTVETTTQSTPKSSNSAIKDISIDANGNLVVTNANNSFSVIGSVQGVPGPIGPLGPQGPAGPQGEKGDSGKDGTDGRGIASADLDNEGNLIITYTDGETHNAGNLLAIADGQKKDYEKVGYSLPLSDSITLPQKGEHYSNHDFGIANTWLSVDSVSVKLVEVNESNPSNKYKYTYTLNFSREENNFSSQGVTSDKRIEFGDYAGVIEVIKLNLDNNKIVQIWYVPFDINQYSTTVEGVFYSSLPYTKIESANILSYGAFGIR